MTELRVLSDRLGVDLSGSPLYERALTHGGHSSTEKGHTPDDYQRLEFLGDRVLGLAICEILYRRNPAESEGDLARRQTDLVRGSRCSEVARELGFAPFIRFEGHENHSDIPDSIFEDVIEALLGAVFIVSGYDEARKCVIRWWLDAIADQDAPPIDPKSALQEWTQSRSIGLPTYRVTGRSGPDHAPIFEVLVEVDGFEPSAGRDASKRAAERVSARAFLEREGLEDQYHIDAD